MNTSFTLLFSDPLLAEDEISGVWRDSDENKWHIVGNGASKLVLVKSGTLRNAIVGVSVINEGHSSTNSIHGTYFKGVILERNRLPHQIARKEALLKLTDNGKLVYTGLGNKNAVITLQKVSEEHNISRK